MADPVTLDEAKAFLRVTHGAEDGLITTLLAAARRRIEDDLSVALSETSPAPLRLCVLMLTAQAYDGRGWEGAALAGWLSPYRTVRL